RCNHGQTCRHRLEEDNPERLEDRRQDEELSLCVFLKKLLTTQLSHECHAIGDAKPVGEGTKWFGPSPILPDQTNLEADRCGKERDRSNESVESLLIWVDSPDKEPNNRLVSVRHPWQSGKLPNVDSVRNYLDLVTIDAQRDEMGRLVPCHGNDSRGLLEGQTR